jgi:uncharacterized protein YktB (UPF0637 family)
MVQDARAVGFPEDLFEVFAIPGFEDRMPRLKELITPRLRVLGDLLVPAVSDLAGEILHPHVALHMRRRVNPPTDTWVAFGPSARGYKSLPHFEVGVNRESVFTRFAIKPEGQDQKGPFFRAVSLARLKELTAGHEVYWYAGEHGEDPVPVAAIKPRTWTGLRARALKKDASLTIGLVIAHDNPVVEGPSLAAELVARLQVLSPLYRAARRL